MFNLRYLGLSSCYITVKVCRFYKPVIYRAPFARLFKIEIKFHD